MQDVVQWTCDVVVTAKKTKMPGEISDSRDRAVGIEVDQKQNSQTNQSID